MAEGRFAVASGRLLKLSHSVVTAADEFEDAFVTKDLELLTDFFTHVIIVGV